MRPGYFSVARSTIPVRGRKQTQRLSRLTNPRTIPVRGRKHRRRPYCLFPHGTIPVRGRKQTLANKHALRFCTIPVRGRKHIFQCSFHNCELYHPRKGTKNSASKKMRSFSFANLNFLFSVGCPSMNGTIAAAVIFSLLRLLHGDKMCYNKANSKHLLQN